MTIQEFYELCLKHGMTNTEMVVSVSCSDTYYSSEEISINEDNIYLNAESNLVDICVET